MNCPRLNLLGRINLDGYVHILQTYFVVVYERGGEGEGVGLFLEVTPRAHHRELGCKYNLM